MYDCRGFVMNDFDVGTYMIIMKADKNSSNISVYKKLSIKTIV